MCGCSIPARRRSAASTRACRYPVPSHKLLLSRKLLTRARRSLHTTLVTCTCAYAHTSVYRKSAQPSIKYAACPAKVQRQVPKVCAQRYYRISKCLPARQSTVRPWPRGTMTFTRIFCIVGRQSQLPALALPSWARVSHGQSGTSSFMSLSLR